MLHDLTWRLSHTRFCACVVEAILQLSPGRDKDKTPFEAHPIPSRGHTTGVQKWYMVRITTIEPARQAISVHKEGGAAAWTCIFEGERGQ